MIECKFGSERKNLYALFFERLFSEVTVYI